MTTGGSRDRLSLYPWKRSRVWRVRPFRLPGLAVFAECAYIRIMPQSLGTAIKEYRVKAGITLRQFATDIGISAAHQSDIEHGRRMPSDEVLRATGRRLAREGGTYEVLKKLDARLKDDVREWVAQTPGIDALLRTAKESGLSVEEMLKRVKDALEKDGGSGRQSR